MEYITSSDFHFKDTAVALGKFEGIHRGHQLLMDEVKKQELHGLRSVVSVSYTHLTLPTTYTV